MQTSETVVFTPADAFKWAMDYYASGLLQMRQQNPLHLKTSLWLFKYVVAHTRSDYPIHVRSLEKIAEITAALSLDPTAVGA